MEFDEQIHASIAADMLRASHSVAETASRLGKVLGRPLTAEELSGLEQARARADELAAERGPDYHGFGNPPDPVR